MTEHLEGFAQGPTNIQGGFDVFGLAVINGEKIAQKTMKYLDWILGWFIDFRHNGHVGPFPARRIIASIHQGIRCPRCNGITHIAATHRQCQ